MVERGVITTSVIVGHVEFIGLWITLKVAGNWRHLAGERDRHRFNCFLIGNGLSLLYGYVGARLTNWPEEELGVSPVLVVFALVSSSSVLALWAWVVYWRSRATVEVRLGDPEG